MRKIKQGDYVKLISVPEWLLKGLPENDQEEIKSFVGKISIIEEIDCYGYFWIGFGVTTCNGDDAEYEGHSFAITENCIELINTE